jgi:hypothetical protein
MNVENRGQTNQSISLTGGMLEASRMIEYLYQITFRGDLGNVSRARKWPT